MRFFFCITGLALTAGLAFSQPAQARHLGQADLYVFAGQSNMRGSVSVNPSKLKYGPSLIPEPYKSAFAQPSSRIFQWNSNDSAPTLDGLGDQAFGSAFVPYRAGFGPHNGREATWGPEVAFLHHRAAETTNDIYFVKYAIGGTTLGILANKMNWNASQSGQLSLLEAMLPRIKRSVAGLRAKGYENVRVRFHWAQGESDTSGLGHQYLINFNGMIEKIKSEIEDPQTSFAVETLTLVDRPSSPYTRAYLNLAATQWNAQIVDVLSYDSTYGRSAVFTQDNVHLNPFGQDLHGTEMELVSRTQPRVFIDNSSTVIYEKRMKKPVRNALNVFQVLELPAKATGSEAFEIEGDVRGLSVDVAKSFIKVSDFTQLEVGTRHILIRRHSPRQISVEKLVLTFY